MPDSVKLVGKQELLPGKHWLVYQNERTGQITKVPEEIMTSPAGTSMLSHMQGYGFGRPPADPAQEGADSANRANMLKQWSGAADAAELAARVPAEVGAIPRGQFQDPVSEVMAWDHVNKKESGELEQIQERERARNTPAPSSPHEVVNLLRRKLQGR